MRKIPLPDGSKLFLAKTVGNPLTAGGATNAADCVVTVPNTLKSNDLVVLDSEDWPEVTGLVARIKSATASVVTLEGINTSDTEIYPPGGKISLIPLPDSAGFQRLPFVPSFAVSGGELQTGNSDYLDATSAEYITGRSPRRLQYSISWNGAGAARLALMAKNGKDFTVHKLLYRDGDATYYVGTLDYNDSPNTEKAKEMATTSTVLLLNAPSFISKI